MGFGAEVKSKDDKKAIGEVLRTVEPEDLIKFGLIPKLIGRLPVIATLEELAADALVQMGRGEGVIRAWIEAAPVLARELGEDILAETVTACLGFASRTSGAVVITSMMIGPATANSAERAKAPPTDHWKDSRIDRRNAGREPAPTACRWTNCCRRSMP